MQKRWQKYAPFFLIVVITALLVTQVVWMVHSIRFQEKVFQKSVGLALTQTMNQLTENKPLCSTVKACVECDSIMLSKRLTSAGVWNQIHDAIDRELHSYGIYLDYEMHILENDCPKLESLALNLNKGQYYTRCLGKIIGKAGFQLVVEFPNRTMYFLQKAGLMFLASVLLIILLIAALVYMLRLYRKELQLAEYTKELLNNVSHEFKTPISSIALASNMIRKKRYANEEKLENYAGLIWKENRKLQNLVDSLLHLAAIERNEFEYNKTPINIYRILDESISSFDIIIAEKGAQIKYHSTDEEIIIVGDELHLTNVISNLISNAIKYSKEKATIEVTVEKTAENVRVVVTDSGIGIPIKYQKYIFDKYYRVPTGDVHNVKGFGIGLAYVKRVIEAHQGNITVKSEVNRGSSFIISLPLMKQ